MNISDEEINITIYSTKSLLFNDTDISIKKNRDPDFEVTMGSFDGAEWYRDDVIRRDVIRLFWICQRALS